MDFTDYIKINTGFKNQYEIDTETYNMTAVQFQNGETDFLVKMATYKINGIEVTKSEFESEYEKEMLQRKLELI